MHQQLRQMWDEQSNEKYDKTILDGLNRLLFLRKWKAESAEEALADAPQLGSAAIDRV